MYPIKSLLLLLIESHNGKAGLNLFTDYKNIKSLEDNFWIPNCYARISFFFFLTQMIFPFCIKIQPKPHLLSYTSVNSILSQNRIPGYIN